MKVKYHSFNLRFKYPFTISKGTKTHQPTFIAELEHMGLIGYGEAPAIAYYDISVEEMIKDLEDKKKFVEKFAFTDPERYWHYLHHLLPKNGFLVCALDMAAWDLYGKIRQKPLHQIWKLDPSQGPMTDYTIGIDTIEHMVNKIREKPWPIYKIKLGTEEDLDIVKALRAHTQANFRVDANAGWTIEKARKIIPELKALGVEFVEQPLQKEDWEGMKALYQESVLPLIADESCVHESDIEKCSSCFHGVNIKLTKCGGITPGRRMIDAARKRNMKVMMGSMNESSVGSAAIAQFLPLLDFVDMDGPLLLEEDLATGIEFDYGRVLVPTKAGLGIEYTGSA